MRLANPRTMLPPLLAGWVLLCARTGSAEPQQVAARAGTETFFVSAGLEPELTTTLLYAHRFEVGDRLSVLGGGGLKLAPVILFHSAAFRAQAMVGASYRWSSGFELGLNTFEYYVHDHSDVGAFDGFGLELRGGPGYAASRWCVALDLGYQVTLLTHIFHGEIVDETYDDRYPGSELAGPRDGWYGITAQRLRFGLAGGLSVSRSVSLRLALGSLFSIQRQGLFFGFNAGQIPFYAEAGVALVW